MGDFYEAAKILLLTGAFGSEKRRNKTIESRICFCINRRKRIMRVETDLIGTKEIEKDAYYGLQTLARL